MEKPILIPLELNSLTYIDDSLEDAPEYCEPAASSVDFVRHFARIFRPL